MLRIINISNKLQIAQNAGYALTFKQRLCGLIGKVEFLKGEALIFKNCKIVHTFFMSYPIDLVFCDKELRVIGTQSDILPWRISKFYSSASLVIELPKKTILENNIKKDDLLKIIT